VSIQCPQRRHLTYTNGVSETQVMTYTHYKIEIDTFESPQHPIIYFRKERKCKTAKGMDRQHNRIVNETVEAWRDYGSQIRRYTVSRVPADVVVRP
jgi:hypothetical protein